MTVIETKNYKDWFGKDTYTFEVADVPLWYPQMRGGEGMYIMFYHRDRNMPHSTTSIISKFVPKAGILAWFTIKDFNTRFKEAYDDVTSCLDQLMKEDFEWYENKKQEYIQNYRQQQIDKNTMLRMIGKSELVVENPSQSMMDEYIDRLNHKDHPRHKIDAYERAEDEDAANLTIVMNHGHPFGP